MWSWQRAQPIVRREEHPAGRVELLVDDVHLLLDGIILGEHLGPDREESGRDDQFVRAAAGSTLGEQVAGDLLFKEPVERLVVR